MDKACSTHGGDDKCVYRKTERKAPLEKPNRRSEDNIKMD
jgi:hypothetical protein